MRNLFAAVIAFLFLAGSVELKAQTDTSNAGSSEEKAAKKMQIDPGKLVTGGVVATGLGVAALGFGYQYAQDQSFFEKSQSTRPDTATSSVNKKRSTGFYVAGGILVAAGVAAIIYASKHIEKPLNDNTSLLINHNGIGLCYKF